MKNKINSDEALAKIKVRISHFYEELGRQNIEETEQERQDLIEDIDDILNQTEISKQHLLMEQLKLDKAFLDGLQRRQNGKD
jgi:hypothetical protein